MDPIPDTHERAYPPEYSSRVGAGSVAESHDGSQTSHYTYSSRRMFVGLQAGGDLQNGQMLAEPRVFRLAAGEPRAGLQSGDVIILRQQGVPFVASQAQLPFKEESLQWVLQLQDPDAEPAPEGCSYLEVVRQGAFIGLRSAAAAERFLQPRRKAPHRLVFFNTNCGVWEQWEVEPQSALGEEPWSQTQLTLRSRRLPQVELTVEAHRIGYFSLSAHAFSTPRTLSIIPEVSMEDSHMTRMSSVMLNEWLRFVAAEKQARGMVEKEVHSLSMEMDDLKSATFGQVDYLRNEMNSEMMSLFTQLQQRQAVIVTQRHYLHRAKTCSISRMMCRRRYSELKALFQAWWSVVCNRLDWRQTVDALHVGRQRSQLLQMLQSWAGHVSRKKLLGLLLVQAIKDFSHRRLSDVFKSWMDLVARMVVLKSSATAMVTRLSKMQLAAAFDTWQGMWRCRSAGRLILTRMVARQDGARISVAFHLWEAAVDDRRWILAEVELLLASRTAGTLHAVLQEWCDITSHAIARRQILLHLLARHIARRTYAVFDAWRAQVAGAVVLRARFSRLISRLAVRRLQHAFTAWADLTTASLLQKQSAASQVVCHTAQEVFSSWHGVLKRTRRHKRMVGWMQSEREGRLLGRVLLTWHGEASCERLRDKHAVTGLNQRRDRSRMHLGLSAMHAAVQRRQMKLSMSSVAQLHHRRQLLCSCFSGWRDVMYHCRAAKSLLEKAHRRLQNRKLTSILQAWVGVVDTRLQLRELAMEQIPPLTVGILEYMLGVCYALANPEAAGWGVPAAVASVPAFGDAATAQISQYGLWVSKTYIRAWMQHTRERRQCHAHAASAVTQRMQYTLRAVLQCWQGHVQQLVQQRAEDDVLLERARRAGQLLQHANRTALQMVFSKWATYTANSRDMQTVLHQRSEQRRLALQQRVFSSWHHESHRTAVLNQLAGTLLRTQGASARLRVLKAWWDQARASAAARLIVRDHVLARSVHQQREMLRCWLEACASARGRSEQATQHASRKLCARVLQRWMAAVRCSMEMSLAASVMRCNSLQSQALAAWLTVVADSHREDSLREERLSVSMRLAKRRQCAAVMGVWKHQARRSAHLQQIEGQVVQSQRLFRIASLFSIWREAASTSPDHQQHCVQLKQRRELQLVTLVLGSWYEASQLSSSRRQASEVLRHAHRRRLLHRITEEWNRLAVLHLQATQACMSICNRIHRAQHKQVFCQWLSLAQHSSSILEQHQKRKRSRAVRCTFVAWHIAARCVAADSTSSQKLPGAGSICLAVEHYCCATLSRSLHSWVSVLQVRKHLQAQQSTLTARLTSLRQSNIMHAWRAAVQWNARTTMFVARCRTRASKQLLARSLMHWADVAAERRTFMDSLRVCIKRKKIAFSLFKNWYWDSFDADVQDTMRHMFQASHDTSSNPHRSAQRLSAAGQHEPYGGHPYAPYNPHVRPTQGRTSPSDHESNSSDAHSSQQQRYLQKQQHYQQAIARIALPAPVVITHRPAGAPSGGMQLADLGWDSEDSSVDYRETSATGAARDIITKRRPRNQAKNVSPATSPLLARMITSIESLYAPTPVQLQRNQQQEGAHTAPKLSTVDRQDNGSHTLHRESSYVQTHQHQQEQQARPLTHLSRDRLASVMAAQSFQLQPTVSASLQAWAADSESQHSFPHHQRSQGGSGSVILNTQPIFAPYPPKHQQYGSTQPRDNSTESPRQQHMQADLQQQRYQVSLPTTADAHPSHNSPHRIHVATSSFQHNQHFAAAALTPPRMLHLASATMPPHSPAAVSQPFSPLALDAIPSPSYPQVDDSPHLHLPHPGWFMSGRNNHRASPTVHNTIQNLVYEVEELVGVDGVGASDRADEEEDTHMDRSSPGRLSFTRDYPPSASPASARPSPSTPPASDPHKQSRAKPQEGRPATAGPYTPSPGHRETSVGNPPLHSHTLSTPLWATSNAAFYTPSPDSGTESRRVRGSSSSGGGVVVPRWRTVANAAYEQQPGVGGVGTHGWGDHLDHTTVTNNSTAAGSGGSLSRQASYISPVGGQGMDGQDELGTVDEELYIAIALEGDASSLQVDGYYSRQAGFNRERSASQYT